MLKKIKKHKKKLKSYSSEYDKAVLMWTAYETVKHERGIAWKIIAAIAVLATVGLSIYYKNWSFALVITVFAVVYYLVHRQEPKRVKIKISQVGVKIDKQIIPFSQIKAFWIIYEPPYFKNLYLKLNDGFFTELPIQLDNMSPGAVREFLLTKIPELENKNQSLSDLFLRIFKI